MKIAILEWGSLFWDPRNLKTVGDWQFKGPALPLEFVRISSDKRITLVIKPSFKKVKTLFIQSAFDDLGSARKNLQEREGSLFIDSIGFFDFSTGASKIKSIPEEIITELKNWNADKDFDAVIWTDLRQNFKDKTGKYFSVHNAKIYLASLKPAEYEIAKNYILQTPPQIKTQHRKEITDFINLRNEVIGTLNSKETFFNVSREKLLNYYPEIVANSRIQFEEADNLATNQRYGMGISHLLISSEEMIKALVVVMDAKGFEFRKVSGMDVFFKNHEIRFFIGFITFVVSLFGEDAFKLLNKFKEDPSKAKELEILLKDESTQKLKFKWYFLRKLVTIRKELEWFSHAEAFRQNGFYVDSKGNLISPLLFTAEDYSETRRRIDRVNFVVQNCCEAFLSEDEGLQKQIEKVKSTFVEKKFYDLIEKELADRRNGKITFFDKFHAFLKDLIETLNDPPFDPNKLPPPK